MMSNLLEEYRAWIAELGTMVNLKASPAGEVWRAG
jgi:hypothetical protein